MSSSGQERFLNQELEKIDKVETVREIRSILLAPTKGAATRTPVRYSDSNAEASELLVKNLNLSRQQSERDFKIHLTERSERLFALIQPIENEIKTISKLIRAGSETKQVIAEKVAEMVLGILRRLSHYETGVYTLKPDIKLFCDALLAGPIESSIIGGILKRSESLLGTVYSNRSGLNQQSVIDEDYDVFRELEELSRLLSWYVKRRAGLNWIDLREQLEVGLIDGGIDSFIDMGVFHDTWAFSVKGCQVTTGLRLIGHDSELLWLKVNVFVDGQPVSARENWIDWVDTVSFDGSVPETVKNVFCSLVPVKPNAQRVIIDEVSAFIPYSALDLPHGKNEVEIVATIVDEFGNIILTASKTEGVSIPRIDDQCKAVPAPHSLGMWPSDVVTGDKVSNLNISTVFRSVEGWEQQTIAVNFDLALLMHAGEKIMLECRLLDEKNRLVEFSSVGEFSLNSTSNQLDDSVSYKFRRVLHPTTAWAQYRDLRLEIPLDFLLLDSGNHRLTCELAVLSVDDRVLCGDLATVNVRLGRDVLKNESTSDETIKAKPRFFEHLDIELESLEIDPQWSFDGSDSVRVQATFVPRSKGFETARNLLGQAGELFAPYRVLIKFEREDHTPIIRAFSDSLGIGFKPVTRSVCVEGHPGFIEHCVVSNFPRSDLLSWSFAYDAARNGKERLFVRVQAATLEGDVFIDESRELFLKTVLPTGVGTVKPLSEPTPRIVDVVVSRRLESSVLSCRAVLNIPAKFITHGALFLQASLDGEVKKFNVDAPIHGMWFRQGLELIQIPVEFELFIPHNSKNSVVLLSLTNESNESLQTVTHVIPEPPKPVSVEASVKPEKNKGWLGYLGI